MKPHLAGSEFSQFLSVLCNILLDADEVRDFIVGASDWADSGQFLVELPAFLLVY